MDNGSGTELIEGAEVAEVLDFTCPRCDKAASSAYYGPCTDCRAVLRATLGGKAREIETGGYEPKMNVTPNQVAIKD